LASFLVLLPLSFVAVVPPFFLSLVAQKRVGRGEGCTIEFRLQPQWLAVAVLFAFLAGFVFAVTGSSSRFGNVTRTGVGRMSAAATLTYVAFAGAGLLLFVATGPPAGAPWLGTLFVLIASVNSFLAIFSMIPLPGFPGGDVWRWSSTLYVGMLVVIVAMMALSLNPNLIARA
jgi:Zn-dependent protease